MNVSKIEMDPGQAQLKLNAYKERLAARHSQQVDAEWRSAMDAYKELAKGTPLIDPVAAIRENGWRPDGRPVLAIARADQKRCRFECSPSWATNNLAALTPSQWTFIGSKQQWDKQRQSNLRFCVRDVTAVPPVQPKQGTAMVPMVPADAMPAKGCDLSKHWILWEVESWDFAPPIDPILLRPIGGDLYAVVAQWDLTEVERAIITGTRR
jgi:hypothetical protein